MANKLEDGDEDCDSEGTSDEEDVDEYVSYLEDAPDLKEQRLLTRRMFPSKVGGKPAWLIPSNLPTEKLVCHHCSRPLRFLLQVYASREKEENRDDAFHRVIHVFVCTSCNPNQVRVFRAQLPRANPFYSFEPPDAEAIALSLEKAGDRDIELSGVVCPQCGMPFDGQEGEVCPECARLNRIQEKTAMFEERELSTYPADFPDDEDDEENDGGGAAGSSKDLEEDPVAQADAVIDSAKAQGADSAVLEKLGDYRERMAESPSNALDQSEEDAFADISREGGSKDPVFAKFQQYCDSNSGHVLRYKYGGEPLWYSRLKQLKGPVPPCDECGAERIFEFQVQPGLISLLEGTRLAERLDYGTICCYVCSKSCVPKNSSKPYMEEFVHVQPEPFDPQLPKG